MKEIRKALETDQDNIDKGYQYLMDTISDHPEIESTLWAGAVWSVLVSGYKRCDFSYDEFLSELDKISRHYKSWWENDEEETSTCSDYE